MTELGMLAEEIDSSERTLRRAAGRGTIRIRRPSPRRSFVTSAEYEYVRRRWPLLRTLVEELRTLPNVRLAVLFGSLARGDDSPESDLDVLVRLRNDTVHARARTAERLERASGRAVQLVTLEEGTLAPSLLADALRDGRVLVDRDAAWPALAKRERAVMREAVHAERERAESVSAALEELGIR